MKGLFRVIVLLIGCTYSVFATVSGSPFTVVIDAGHGGRDPGAMSKRLKEKDINLSVALKLGSLIRENHPDVKVIYTRRSDAFVDLQYRADIANKAKADLFISIHSNATKSRATYGAETYTLGLARSEENLDVAKRENSVILLEDDYRARYEGFDPNSTESYIIFEMLQNNHLEQSIALAADVQKEFRGSANRKDNGVRQAGFLVLRNTGMPSVLVELGYLSNATDESFLRSEPNRHLMARSIYRAFRRYKVTVDQKQGFTSGQNRSSADDYSSEEMDVTAPVEQEDRSTSSRPAQSSGVRRQTQTQAAARNAGKVVYKIQILTHNQKLSPNSKLFKGLSPVECFKEGRVYKYTYKSASTFNEIERERKKITTKFKDAFVIRFKNGERIK